MNRNNDFVLTLVITACGIGAAVRINAPTLIAEVNQINQ